MFGAVLLVVMFTGHFVLPAMSPPRLTAAVPVAAFVLYVVILHSRCVRTQSGEYRSSLA